MLTNEPVHAPTFVTYLHVMQRPILISSQPSIWDPLSRRRPICTASDPSLEQGSDQEQMKNERRNPKLFPESTKRAREPPKTLSLLPSKTKTAPCFFA
ncbi:hypothetical protein VNO77_34582 [Canavalia gladiata]|uniref:Uncharacterized protein n=1 Tax=Canavalia gladiata TaxID=3824 RepID=A0AAN9KGE1_CANGL